MKNATAKQVSGAIFSIGITFSAITCSIEARAGAADSAQASIEYVLSQQAVCTQTDGYRCQARDEAQLVLNQQHMVAAVYLQAWPIAYADFLALESLSEVQKSLQHYKIGFAENGDHYIVIFSALLLPELDAEGQPTKALMRSTLGRSMRYEIDRQSLKIVSRKLYR